MIDIRCVLMFVTKNRSKLHRYDQISGRVMTPAYGHIRGLLSFLLKILNLIRRELPGECFCNTKLFTDDVNPLTIFSNILFLTK